MVLAEPGSQVVLELAETFGKYEIVAEHNHTGTARKVSAIRSDLGNTGDSIAMAEISSSKNLRSDTLVATLANGALVVQEIEATSKNSHRVGPSPSSETFVEVKRESKKMKDGEKLLFIRPVSEQVKVNLKWDNQQDLDLNCFVELNSGLRVIYNHWVASLGLWKPVRLYCIPEMTDWAVATMVSLSLQDEQPTAHQTYCLCHHLLWRVKLVSN